MNATTDIFPFDLRWTSQDLADAVPLRLFAVDAFAPPGDAASSANAASLARRPRRERSYLPARSMPAHFRIQG